ncbi:anaerobic ribonucleoside-triphosphate reductase activating protein [Treponema endosymbiont of Eucomonympha sp.]|uniref:anaerobic ribonucleoside-triphosphate reductase activating protein n=1 Tax=Treponema endosymbiont of Eucomonympha sp. TaxID=1580831 RepID=UPI000751425F|nr:anaerobic ribonucleoside-triphosphate reductase activating protein [Treponema endosymbiont of Eucomonympha sp.]
MPVQKPVGVLVKTSLVDYPGEVAAAVFLRGCNLRCPYCYNADLVTGDLSREDAATVVEIIEHLERRKNVLTGFVLSGGEPLFSPTATELVAAARSAGYKIKLDTNGTLPEILEQFLTSPRLKPDFIALDIKTSPSRYALLSQNQADCAPLLTRSVALVSALPTNAREFRTVLTPPLVGSADILAIAALLPKDAAWMFAPFQSGNCLDPSYNECVRYTEREMNALVETAARAIPGAALR